MNKKQLPKFSNLLLGNRNNSSYGEFTTALIGKKRLSDKDKDRVPDIFDCQPNNFFKDSTVIIPTQLQSTLKQPTQSVQPEQIESQPQQRFIEPQMEQQQNIKVSYGGSEFYLTPEKYDDAIGMYQSYLKKGKLPSASGHSGEALDYAGALISKASSSESALRYNPSEREVIAGFAKPVKEGVAFKEGEYESYQKPEQKTFMGPLPRGASEEIYRRTGKTVYVQSGSDLRGGTYSESKVQTEQGGGGYIEKSSVSPSGVKTIYEHKRYQGPVRQGMDVETFRETGKEVPMTTEQKIKQIETIYQSPITGKASGETQSDYNARINEAYKQSLKTSGIKIRYGLGDDVKGFSFEDIQQGGYYDPSKKEMYVNLVGSWLYGGPKKVIVHEYGHVLSFGGSFTGNEYDYREAGTQGSGLFRIEKSGAYKDREIVEEYRADAFSLFIKNPEEFKSKYPNVAREYEGILGIGTSQQSSTIFNTQSKSPFSVTGGVVGISTETRKVEEKKVSVSPFGESVLGYGPISGTLKYIGEESKKLVGPQSLSISSDYLPYETRGTGTFNFETKTYEPLISKEEKQRRIEVKTEATKEAMSSTIQTLPYLTPFGNILLITTATESLLYPKAREELKETGLALKEKYGVPEETALLIPAGQIVLGSFGLFKQVKGFQAKQELKVFEKTPTKFTGYRIEGEKGGVEVLFGKKEIPKTFFGGKGSTYYTKITNPYINVGDNKVIFEEGLVSTFRKSGDKLTFLGSKVTGTGQTAKATDVITEMVTPTTNAGLIDSLTKTKTTPLTAEASLARIKYEDLLKGKFRTKVGIEFPTGREIASMSGKVKPTTGTTYANVFGLQDKTDDVITFLSGDVTKTRLYPDTGRITFIGEKPIKSYGEIKVIKFGGDVEDTGVRFLQPAQIEKTPLSKTFSAPIVEKSMSRVVPSISKATKVTSATAQLFGNELPSMVGGTGLIDVPFTGTGLYERTEQTGKGFNFGMTGFVTQEPSIKTYTPTIEKEELELGVTTVTSELTKQQPRQLPRQEQVPLEILDTSQGIRLDTSLRTEQESTGRQVTVPGLQPPKITPKTRTPIIPIPFFFPGEKVLKGERTGYHTFVKEKGRNKQVSSKPMTRNAAMDLGARIVDNTVSGTFNIEPIKQTKFVKGKKQEVIRKFKEDELQKGNGYFGNVANKFREFVIRRGDKIATTNQWIEKKDKRNDTRGEQQGLTVAQFQARQFKSRAGLPTRKKNKRSGGVNRYFGI